MTDANYTDITVVLDRSGSMVQIKSDTEGGFDSFIAEQKKIDGKCLVTLAQFDNQYEVVYEAKDVQDVPNLVLVPGGVTALLDAIGKTVVSTGERLAALPEDERPGKVIFVIITDGYENASQEWSKDAVNKVITEQTEKYGWDFLFLAANQDAIAVGGSLGIAGNNSITYDTNSAAVANVFAATSRAVGNYRAGYADLSYTDDDRNAAVK